MQELRAADETLRTLQVQLELVPSPSSSTVKVLLDTKDARIATLEREVQVLEREVERLGGGPPVLQPQPSLASLLPRSAAASYVDLHTTIATPTPIKRQVSFLLNDVQVGKDDTILGRL